MIKSKLFKQFSHGTNDFIEIMKDRRGGGVATVVDRRVVHKLAHKPRCWRQLLYKFAGLLGTEGAWFV